MLKLVCSLSASSVLLLASVVANASPITIDSSTIRAVATDGVGGSVNNSDSSLAFGSRSLLAVDGTASSSTDSNWIDTGSGALFDFDLNHTRTGTYYSYAQTRESSLDFTANAATTYSVSGQYSVSDISSAGAVYSYVYLLDITAGGFLFEEYNFSTNTVNESFTVGIAGEGDTNNIFQGALTGNLIAGNQYRFYFNNYIHAYPTADGGGSATGCVTLSIGGAIGAGSCGNSVPEPMPLTLLGAGLAALGLRRLLLVKAA